MVTKAGDEMVFFVQYAPNDYGQSEWSWGGSDWHWPIQNDDIFVVGLGEKAKETAMRLCSFLNEYDYKPAPSFSFNINEL